MTEQEKAAHDALVNEFKAMIADAQKNQVNASDLEALKSKLSEFEAKESVSKEEFEAVKKVASDLETIVKALKEEGSKNDKPQSSVRKALEANKAKLTALKEGSKGDAKSNEFSFKVVATMLEADNISGGNVPVEQRIAGFNTIASRRTVLFDLFTRGTASSNIISWVYQANKDGAAGGTEEGETKNQIDFDLVVASQPLVKRTAYIKVSTEMLDDIDFIESEIRNELMREVMKDLELTAYSGNGTAPALNGVYTVATTFAAGTFAGTVDNANEVDVLAVAINQILIANQPMPNYILMHPSDVTKLKLVKLSSSDKRYIDRLMIVAGTLNMDGVPILPTTLVSVGTFLMGSFDLATMYTRGDVQIEIGLDGNDFTKNLRTIIAEVRAALVVKNNDRTAFVKGTFSTAKTALETT
jgi:HK97 family phage major capsid protein